jgi:predicted  nucleic acid-binding Zn-ribbon protein
MLCLGLLIGVAVFSAQTHSDAKPEKVATCGLERSDLQDEAKDLSIYTQRMQARIVMIRNSAGVVQNPEIRNALQVDAEMWQDQLDHLKLRMTRLQTAIERCEAREKINANK